MKQPSSSKLRQAITQAARATFTKLRDTHPKETFYAFALYTSNESNYITASANTEEGLLERAKRREKREKKGLKRHADLLRWNPPDWVYHCAGDDQFEEAQKMLDVLSDSCDLDEDEFEKEFDTRLAVFIDGLKELDAEGFFGRGKERQKVTLLVAMGDQETKLLLKCAQQLNPTSVYQAFATAFPTETAGKFKGIGSRNVYETRAAILSRDGKLLACPASSTGGSPYVFGFALPSQKEILKLSVRDLVTLWALAVSPDGTSVFAGWQSLCGDGKEGIRCWNVRTKKLRWDVKTRQAISLDASPDGALIASGDTDGNICLWDAHTGKVLRNMRGHKGSFVECVRFSPDGRILGSCGSKAVHLWDPSSGQKIGSIADSGDALAFSPDGQVLAIATGQSKKRDVSIWEVGRRKLVTRLDVIKNSRFRVMRGPDDYEDVKATGVAFSPDGQLLVVERSWPGSVVLWDWKKAKELTWMNPNYENLDGVVFLPDGKTVAVAGRPMSGPPLLLWDISHSV
jgi:WD40 repeat protein